MPRGWPRGDYGNGIQPPGTFLQHCSALLTICRLHFSYVKEEFLSHSISLPSTLNQTVCDCYGEEPL